MLVEAVRTPFVQSGTVFQDLMPHDLARHALKGDVTTEPLSHRHSVNLSRGTQTGVFHGPLPNHYPTGIL